MSSPIETPFVEIDPKGDMFIKAFEFGHDEHSETVLIRVSSQVLINNSDIFKVLIETHDIQTPLEIHNVSPKSLEIWLRIFHHGNLPEELWLQLQLVDIINTWDLGLKYKFKVSRFRAWFSFWLGHYDLSTATPATLLQLADFCQKFQHRVGAECIAALSSPEDHHLPRAFSLYPPIPEMSLLQSSYELQLFGVVSPEDYTTWAFSPGFKAIYGSPTVAYSDFYRLITIPFDHSILPNYKIFEVLCDQQSTFLDFCKNVDFITNKRNLPPVARRVMEGAWACVALELYDNLKSEWQDPRALRKVFEMRFHPKQKVEEYWTEKRSQYEWDVKDVECLEDNCEEPDDEIAEPDEDEEMEDAVAVPSELDRELGESLEGLEIDEADEKYEGMDQDQLMEAYKRSLEKS